MNISDFKFLIDELADHSFRLRSETDTHIDLALKITDCFLALGSQDRQVALKMTDDKVSKQLLALSGLTAEAAVNKYDQDMLRTVLILHLIEGFGFDYRENIRQLILINYAATRLKVEMQKIVLPLLTFASERATEQLNNFLDRDQNLNNLSAFGIVATEVNGSFEFVQAPRVR